jgi:hypothetical protein
MGDRFLVGYPYAGAWHKPDMKVVSLYVDQKPEGDLSGDRAREFGFEVYPTVSEALRCGGKQLAVDAVLIIGEHGNYPRNEKGQVLYPRYEFFEQCVKVLSRTAAPCLSTTTSTFRTVSKKPDHGDASRRLRFLMLAVVHPGHLVASIDRPALGLPNRRRLDDR